MANTVIQLKHSTETGNVPSSLANGEISINSRDGKFFYSTPANVVVTHYPYLGPSGLDTEIQFNDSGTIGGSEKLTFNKNKYLYNLDYLKNEISDIVIVESDRNRWPNNMSKPSEIAFIFKK